MIWHKNCFSRGMKNQVTILLISIHLLAHTDISQLLKFPELIRHYHHHHSRNSSLSFIDFLAMHYGNSTDHGKEGRDDMKLPFKAVEFHLIAHATVVPRIFAFSQPCIELPQGFICNFESNFKSVTHTGYLLRPPIS